MKPGPIEEFVVGVLLLVALVYVLKLASRPLARWGDVCDRWFKNTRYVGFAVYISPFVALAAGLAYWITFHAEGGGGSWLLFTLYFVGFGGTLAVLLAFMLDLSG